MCGIAGTTGNAIDRMLPEIKHRGPDAVNVWRHSHFSMGIQRLSVIDVDGPSPPHWNEDRTCCVVCNGEIYNYRELKAELIQKGHQFRTNSDTEVIVHLYEEYGEHAPEYLRGMFAFAVYDIPRGQLFLARDRFGEKPLFYFKKDHHFAFASVLNALLVLPELPRAINHHALPQYLQMGFVQEPETLLEYVYSLPPGHFLIRTATTVTTGKWFELTYRSPVLYPDIQTAAAELDTVLQQAVRRQLVADVPVGALLSGGLDSSAIVAAMAGQSSGPVKTFHVRMAGSDNDESAVAKAVSDHFGTDHYEITLPNGGFEEQQFWDLLSHTGFPFPDATAIPFYRISREVRQQVKVVMSGDGGDELFGGYDYYRTGLGIATLKNIPGVIRQSALPFARVLQQLPGTSRITGLRKVIKALEGAALSQSAFFPWHFGWMDDAATRELCGAVPQYDHLLPEGKPWDEWSLLRQMMWFSTKYNLPLDMLVKTDRMSMANGLEVRAPFLDADMFDFAAKLPDNLLVSPNRGKLVLWEMLKNKLPASVLEHRKTGFITPLHLLWNDAFRQLATGLLLSPHPLDALIDKKVVARYLQTGLTQTADTSRNTVFRATHQLWLLVQLYAWALKIKL